MTSALEHPDWLASSLLADVGAYALAARIKPLDPAWRLWGRPCRYPFPRATTSPSITR